MIDINELIARMKAAAQEEIMFREACDTSDLWQEEASPENVLALTEALEKREELRAAANKVVVQQDIEIYDLRQRIAELEARTLTVKLPQRAAAGKYVDEEFNNSDLAAIYNACRLECEVKFKNACAAAGIKLQIEGE